MSAQRCAMTTRAWNTALHDYATAQRAAGRSARTVNLYRHYLSLLAIRTRTPGTVTTGQLREVLAAGDWSPEARKSARTAFRGFFRWAHGSGLIPDDPAMALEPVRVPPGVPRAIPDTILGKALVSADDRLRFVMLLAGSAGLRAAEIAQVHSRDLIGDALRVHGKGGRTRVVPIENRELQRRLDGLDGWAFPTPRGGHITPGHVSRIVSAALPDGWTCHTLRHRFASAAYGFENNLLAVGTLLGHTRPETTQRYITLRDDALRRAARAAAMIGDVA